MPSALERRLDRIAMVFGKGGDDIFDHLLYATDDDDAELWWRAAKEAGKPDPLIMVCGRHGVGPNLDDLIADIARKGRRIHDPMPEADCSTTRKEGHIYYPPDPRGSARHCETRNGRWRERPALVDGRYRCADH